jgi:zinc protease
MVNLHITEKELLPEKQVVLEERRMRVDNVPAELLDEAVREQLFGHARPYAMPTIGYVEDVKKLGVTGLTNFYRKHYAPNNAVLIVAGDTTPDAVRKLAEKYYGPIAKVQLEPRRRPADGGAGLPQRVIRADARVVQPEWSRDFLAPSYTVGEKGRAYALSVLAQLFGGGETSRLWRAMVVDSKLALEVAAGYGPTSLGLTSFELSATPAAQSSMAAIEAAVADQMKKVLDGEVTAEEVERAQNKLLASAIYSQDSLGSGPRVYASYLSTGGSVADVDAWPERIAAVRPSDVVGAARDVWRDEAAVTSLLTPAEGAK